MHSAAIPIKFSFSIKSFPGLALFTSGFFRANYSFMVNADVVAVRNNQKVFNTIVHRIFIYVMNMLRWGKFSTQMFLHYFSVFKNPFSTTSANVQIPTPFLFVTDIIFCIKASNLFHDFRVFAKSFFLRIRNLFFPIRICFSCSPKPFFNSLNGFWTFWKRPITSIHRYILSLRCNMNIIYAFKPFQGIFNGATCITRCPKRETGGFHPLACLFSI